MNNSIFNSDLFILLKLYAPKAFQLDVWDPMASIVADEPRPLNIKEGSIFKVLIYVPNTVADYTGSEFSNYDLVLDFSKTLSFFSPIQENVNFINNPNGKMRWLYSDKNKKATFLKFYNEGSVKAKLTAAAVRIGFALGLQGLIHNGSFRIHSKNELKLNTLTQEVPHKDYSLFLGSEGDNRTVLVEVNAHNNNTHFLKIPITPLSGRSVTNEKRFLQLLQNRSFPSMSIPKLVESKFDDIVITEAFDTSQSKRSSELTDLHYAALTEMLVENTQFSKLLSSKFWQSIQDNLSVLASGASSELSLKMMQQLTQELSVNEAVYTSLSHGDFTPWNMFVTARQIQVYDWEMAESQMPLLFDLFHFYFQSGILVDHISFEEIKKNIIKACAHPKIQNVISIYGVDLEVYLKLYILKASTKYFIDFKNQPNLNTQNTWIKETLEVALAESCETSTAEQRPLFIRELNSQMQSIGHAYLKLLAPEITQLSINSDLDIVVEKEAIIGLVAFCKAHAHVQKVNVYTKSFMTTVEVYFQDQGFLALDLIHAFKRKQTLFMDAQTMISSARPNEKGYQIPNPVLDFEYAYLFYQLNGSSIPKKYQDHYSQAFKGEGNKALNQIQKKYDLSGYSQKELMRYTPQIQKQLLTRIAQLGLNSGMKKVKNLYTYVVDTVNDLVNRQGMVITFSGVDGAGKTTIITKVKSKLENKYRKEVVLLRHRPGILPILSAMKHGKEGAEQIASVTMPRLGKNSNVFSSLARFAYYFSDYLFGQVYVYFKYTLRGKVVLYDRYYFDFINDAKRSNIELNRGFVKSLYRFVFKPDLNFFLYADAATILSRKQEMVEEEIVRISSLYQNLFNEMNDEYKTGVYTSIENKNLDNTLSQVLESYQKVA